MKYQPNTCLSKEHLPNMQRSITEFTEVVTVEDKKNLIREDFPRQFKTKQTSLKKTFQELSLRPAAVEDNYHPV